MDVNIMVSILMARAKLEMGVASGRSMAMLGMRGVVLRTQSHTVLCSHTSQSGYFVASCLGEGSDESVNRTGRRQAGELCPELHQLPSACHLLTLEINPLQQILLLHTPCTRQQRGRGNSCMRIIDLSTHL